MTRILSAVLLMSLGSFCSAAEQQAIMLLYEATEPGLDPFASRVLVTEKYLRMDDGTDDGDYLVMDREKKIIYNVIHSDRTVFEIPARPVEIESPMALKRESRQLPPDPKMPEVAGKAPRHHKLLVNGKQCYSVVAVPGLMNEAVVALGEFRTILAGEHAKLVPVLPADLQEPCDLALHTFAPTWQLQFGLPLQEWDEEGNAQALVDYDQAFSVDRSLFALPEGYTHFDTDALK